MTPGQLVKAVAVALDVPEEAVTQHDRNLVMAGLRTKGGRGPSAPSVTHRDAARLIASILGAVKVKDSASVVRRMERATVINDDRVKYEPLPLARFAELSADHNFIDALTAIIEEVDTPEMFQEFPEFARRFSGLWIRSGGFLEGAITYLTEPIVRTERGLKGVIDILYRAPRTASAARATEGAKGFLPWDLYYGVEQERKIRGNCLMILGLCFQKGPVSSIEAAFRAWKAKKFYVG
jgi:hypothetical protein